MKSYVCWIEKLRRVLTLSVAALQPMAAPFGFSAPQPTVTSVVAQNNNLMISASIPAGYRHAVLEAGDHVTQTQRESLVAGGMDGSIANVTFRIPMSASAKFLRVRVGAEAAVPPSTLSGP
ncbi:MAG: hypothetical protein L0Z50_20720, partial [Verrucomicrobiales bacterium]|nr:hypothetical protein [Verrucomicrobiales bacterium]